MRSVLGLTALWLVFGGMHIGLATCRVRDGLVSRLGERGFLALFSFIAAVSFSVLVHYYTLHRFDGPPGLALGAVPVLRWTLMAVVVAGIVMVAASLVVCPRLPIAVLLRTVHGSIFAHGGAWVIAAVLGAAALGGVQSALRVRRRPLPSDGSLDSGSSSRSAGSCSGQLGVRSVAPVTGLTRPIGRE